MSKTSTNESSIKSQVAQLTKALTYSALAQNSSNTQVRLTYIEKAKECINETNNSAIIEAVVANTNSYKHEDTPSNIESTLKEGLSFLVNLAINQGRKEGRDEQDESKEAEQSKAQSTEAEIAKLTSENEKLKKQLEGVERKYETQKQLTQEWESKFQELQYSITKPLDTRAANDEMEHQEIKLNNEQEQKINLQVQEEAESQQLPAGLTSFTNNAINSAAADTEQTSQSLDINSEVNVNYEPDNTEAPVMGNINELSPEYHS